MIITTTSAHVRACALLCLTLLCVYVKRLLFLVIEFSFVRFIANRMEFIVTNVKRSHDLFFASVVLLLHLLLDSY